MNKDKLTPLPKVSKDRQEIVIYGHGSSANHGNEAIVRGIKKIFPEWNIILFSYDPEIDFKFSLDEVCEIFPMYTKIRRYSIKYFVSKFFKVIFKSSNMLSFFVFKDFRRHFIENRIYLLEAGDQYCEPGFHRDGYAYLNRYIHRRGSQTIMLGCTINENLLANKKLVKDLKLYEKIIARESITYDALRKICLKNVYLAPDPAFAMDEKNFKLPKLLFNTNSRVIGINVGFLAQGNEKYFELMISNCKELIKYILINTSYKIALIPHVYWGEKNSDYNTLKPLSEYFDNASERIFLINEYDAEKAKYIMSNCYLMIGLRTHACISSISSCVPTLVTGYKIKSTGIVRDIFNDQFMVLKEVSSLEDKEDYIQSFKYLEKNHEKILNYLVQYIPIYKKKLNIIKEEVTSTYNEFYKNTESVVNK